MPTIVVFLLTTCNILLILALEIGNEDGALVDYFVDEFPVRELELDQEDDQILPEKVTRAARYKLSTLECPEGTVALFPAKK